MGYTIKEVNSKKTINDFVLLPSFIYKDNPCYIPDLEGDVRDFFNTKKNPDAQTSELQAFVAYDNDGRPVGRIAGIINHKANDTWKSKNVRFGMIEFIDDMEVSSALLQAVAQWGKDRGMNKIQGPLGVTDFDKEGMLLEDFDKEGSMVSIYNPEYYPKHMEKLGFGKEADWIHVRFDIPKSLPPRYERTAKLVGEMYGLHIRHLSRRDLLHRGYGARMFALLNKAYRPLFGFSELSEESQKKFLHQYLPIADLRMIPTVEDQDGRMVGVGVTIGSLSHALRKSKGRLFPLGWFHLLKAIKFKHEDKVEMLLIAIDPEYQGMGVNALIFNELIQVYNKLGYKWAETGPMLEDNLKVLSQWKGLSPTFYKRRRCFCKEI